MTGLTKELREAAVTKALAAHFKDREARLEAARTALADALYDYAFGAVEKQARKLPAGWLSKHRGIYIQAPGYSANQWSTDPKKGPSANLNTSKDHLFPHHVGAAFKVEAGHPCHVAAQAIVKEHHAIIDDKEELRTKLRTILYACNTLKQLRELWPEGERFLPVMPSGSRALVPVTTVAEVNQKLGLAKRKATKERAHA